MLLKNFFFGFDPRIIIPRIFSKKRIQICQFWAYNSWARVKYFSLVEKSTIRQLG